MINLATQAMAFAQQKHRGQMYGRQPYFAHLASVVGVLMDFGFGTDQEIIAAGWLHDVIEDQDVTFWELDGLFGNRVAQLVNAVSGEGVNRATRNLSIRGKIMHCTEAAIVKLADRIANVEQAEPGSRHFVMYLSELPEFERTIRQYVPEGMWHRLERAFARKVAA